ncbi:MAG: lytic murein transglycosylase [Thermodesulfobacteriota bacterium]
MLRYNSFYSNFTYKAALWFLSVSALFVLIPPCLSGAEEQTHLGQWVGAFKKEALTRGISPGILDQAFKDFEPIARIIELDRNQPEFTFTLEEYLSRVVSKSRVDQGREMLNRHRPLLERVYKHYNVQPRFLIALWGIESNFGLTRGTFPVIHAIATLAHDGRRSTYFRTELIHALRIIEEGHISLGTMRGSWAGAMGHLQFMPSSFHNFGVDFAGDARIDIWGNLGDAFASAANYLSRSGWSKGQTWGREVSLPPNFDREMIGLETRKRLSTWQSLGVRRVDGKNLPKRPDLFGSILQPEGKGGRAFVVYENFRAILAWNKSDFFALGVGTLADKIVGR